MGKSHQLFVHNAFMTFLKSVTNGSRQVALLERYLYDPLVAFNGGRYGDFAALDIKILERRLSLLYNTLWKASWLYPAVVSGNMTSIIGGRQDVGDSSGGFFRNTTSQTTRPLPPRYTINSRWMALYFTSVAVMLAACIFSLVMHSLCRAPAILGFTSSLMRDSVYFNDPKYSLNSTKEGPKRSKRLGSVKVMVADVQGHGGVGKVAFVPVGEGMGNRVETKRWYE